MTIKVICPGYGRTGTNSLKEALEILGFGPSYHMWGILNDHVDTHPQMWIDGFQGRGLPVHKIFDGYKSVTDWPASNFYQKIMHEYPDAKIVLTSRDPDSWWKSVKDTVHTEAPLKHTWGMFFLTALVPQIRTVSYMLRHITILNMEEAEAKAEFLRHTAEVKDEVSADKLLEFSVKDGWEPLCAFLGVPIPDISFPKSNSREEFNTVLKRVSRNGWIAMLLAITAAGVSVGVASFLGGRRIGGAVAALIVCLLSSCVMGAIRVNRFYGKKAA